MNYIDRKNLKRTTESRDKWKCRALENAAESRSLMFKNRDLDRSRASWRNKAEKIAEESKAKDGTIRNLLKQVEELKESVTYFKDQSEALAVEKKILQT